MSQVSLPTNTSSDLLIEAIPHIVWIADFQGKITYLNQQWQEYTGLTVAESLGKKFFQTIHPQDRQKIKKLWGQSILGKKTYDTHLKLRQASGIYHSFIARANPVKGDDGQVREWLGTYTHVGQIEDIETELNSKQQFLQALLNNLSDGIVACDEKGILTLFNRTTQEFHGLPQQPIPPEEWGQYYDLYLVEGKPLTQENIPLFKALQGESVRNQEMMIIPKNGIARTVLASGEPIISSEGKKLGAVVAMRDITQRKQAEAALEESERRFRAIFNQTFQFVGLLQPDGILLEANQTALDFGGLTLEEVVGQPFWTIRWWTIAPETQQQLQKAIASAAKGEFIRYEVNVLGHLDQVATIDFSLKPLFNDQEEVVVLIAEGRDITQRKQAEAEIIRLNQDLEQRVKERTASLEAANQNKDELIAKIHLYQDIVENIPVGLCIWQLEDLRDFKNFRLVAANPAASEMLNLEMQDYIGEKLINCFPGVIGTNHQIAVETYAQVIRDQQSKKLGAVYYEDSRIGSVVFDIKAFPLPDQCVGVAFENITERKKIEKALVESTRKYRLVVNSVKEVIFQTDLNGCWTFLNPAWTQITGFSIMESLYRPFTDYISTPFDQQRCLEFFQSLITEQEEFFHYEFTSQTKEGYRRCLEINAQINRDVEGQILGISGTINDITERKQSEASLQARADELARVNSALWQMTSLLEKRNQELDQFAYVTSHDLKAPLRAIANLSEWIEEDLEDKLTEETREQMNLLRGRVHRMENLINGLLEYSRVGRFSSQRETVEVEKLLHEIIDSLAPPQEFTINIEGKMPTLMTQRLPLQQVFTNLISNGIKHHHSPNGTVTISVEDQDDRYQFTVSDDGPGIASDYYEKIFVIFQTLKARDKIENTGIGLSIVKKIIESQGGSIKIESQVGKGTTFKFIWLKNH